MIRQPVVPETEFQRPVPVTRPISTPTTSGCRQQRRARGHGIFRRVIGGPETAPERSDEEAACARLD